MKSPLIVAALVALCGTVATGIISALNSRSTRREVKSPNGKPTGEYVHLIYEEMLEIRRENQQHRDDPDAHAQMRIIWDGTERRHGDRREECATCPIWRKHSS